MRPSEAFASQQQRQQPAPPDILPRLAISFINDMLILSISGSWVLVVFAMVVVVMAIVW